jgi:hypothetical protein
LKSLQNFCAELCAKWMATMTDLKTRLAAVPATPQGKAWIEKGQQFSTEQLQAAFAELLEEADGYLRVVIEAARSALIARRAN